MAKEKVDDGITRLDIVALVSSAVAPLVIVGGKWWHNMTKVARIAHGGVQVEYRFILMLFSDNSYFEPADPAGLQEW
jgi:hypothetical protein